MGKKHELIFKFNGGIGAICCSICKVIIATGVEINWEAATSGTLGPQYCPKHIKTVKT